MKNQIDIINDKLNDKVNYKINKYNSKYSNSTNLESKLIYSIKLNQYINQLGGTELDDKIQEINLKLDTLGTKLDEANSINNIVKQVDNSLVKIIQIPRYNKESNDLVTYYQDVITKIQGFNIE